MENSKENKLPLDKILGENVNPVFKEAVKKHYKKTEPKEINFISFPGLE